MENQTPPNCSQKPLSETRKFLLNITTITENGLPVIARIGGAASQFGIFLIVSYALTPHDAAIVFKFQVWSVLASALTQFGMSILALRMAKKTRSHSISVVYRCLSILLIPCFIWPFSATLGYYVSGGADEWASLYFMMVLGNALCQIEGDLYRALGRNILSSVITLSPSFATLVIVLLGLKNITTHDIISVMSMAYLITGAMGLFALLYQQRHALRKIRIPLLMRYMWSIAGSARTAITTSMFSVLSMQVDQAIMSRLAAPEVFAQYATAVRIAQAVNVLINALNPIVTTYALNLRIIHGKEEVGKFLTKYTKVLSAGAFSVSSIFGAIIYFVPIIQEVFTFESFSMMPTLCLVFPMVVNLATGPKGYLIWIFGYDVLVRKILFLTILLLSAASASYAITGSITITAALVGAGLLSQYIVEIIIVRRIVHGRC